MKQNEIKLKYFQALLTGVFAPFRAIQIVMVLKGLKRHFIIPFLLNIIILTTFFIISYSMFGNLLQSVIPVGDQWYLEVLRFVISPLLFIILTIVCAMLYSITGSIIIAPFNDIISAKVERMITGDSFDEKFSFDMFLNDGIRIIFNVIKLLIILFLFNIIILFLNLIPIAGNILYSVLSFSAMWFFLGFQFFDFPLERRRMEFREKLNLLWRYKFTTTGLGLGFFIISLIPIIGFLGLNLAAVGATILYIEQMKRG